jgi:hypothetical protein
MKKLIISTILLLSLSCSLYADDSAFCNEPETWKNFESMAKKYPDDVPVQILHALRIGLCVKIDQNSISTTEAINLFNDMLDIVANKRGEIEEQEKKKEL